MEFACANFSQDSVTLWLWSISPQYRAANLTLSAFLILFMLIGIPWNLLLIVIIIKKRLFKKPAVLLLLNLAVTNLLLCVAMPMMIIPALAGEFIFGQSDYARCRVCYLSLIMSILLLMSVHNIALLSLDRFLYVKKPLQYKNIVTIKRVAAILTFCWVLFTAFSILPVFGVGEVDFVQILPACTLNFDARGLNVNFIYYWVFSIGSCLAPVIIFLSTTTWMVCIVLKNMRKVYTRAKKNSLGGRNVSAAHTRAKYAKDQIRVVQIFMALFLFSLATWLPILITLTMVNAADVFVLEFTTFSFLCLLSQPVVHPILQMLLLRDVRTVFVQLCMHFSGCQYTSNDNTVSNNEDKSGCSNTTPLNQHEKT